MNSSNSPKLNFRTRKPDVRAKQATSSRATNQSLRMSYNFREATQSPDFITIDEYQPRANGTSAAVDMQAIKIGLMNSNRDLDTVAYQQDLSTQTSKANKPLTAAMNMVRKNLRKSLNFDKIKSLASQLDIDSGKAVGTLLNNSVPTVNHDMVNQSNRLHDQ